MLVNVVRRSDSLDDNLQDNEEENDRFGPPLIRAGRRREPQSVCNLPRRRTPTEKGDSLGSQDCRTGLPEAVFGTKDAEGLASQVPERLLCRRGFVAVIERNGRLVIVLLTRKAL